MYRDSMKIYWNLLYLYENHWTSMKSMKTLRQTYEILEEISVILKGILKKHVKGIHGNLYEIVKTPCMYEIFEEIHAILKAILRNL